MTKPRKKIKEKTAVSAVIPWLSRSMGWEKQLDQYSLFVKWQEIVGEDLREHAQPQKIERGILWLEVENSSWLQEFQYSKMQLLEKLNSVLQLTSLHDVKMVLPKDDIFKKQENAGPVVTFVRPSPEKIAAFQRQAACIADEACRDALVQFWYLAEACKREKK